MSNEPVTPMSSTKPHARRGVFIVAIFKLFTGSSLLVVSLGLLRYLHRDLRHAIHNFINLFRVDPDNRYVAALLAKLGLVDDRHLKELAGLAAIYAILHLVEGTGLLLHKRWAEWLTVIATGSFVPMEIYEITRHCTISRIALLTGNVVIVCYLIWVLKQKQSAPGT
ncbi:MAG: DUF2127 domain-containing protein [Chthoniobacter sp.]|nr:DUF2127 domain-containing protein [Chthoniobacter sp.]